MMQILNKLNDYIGQASSKVEAKLESLGWDESQISSAQSKIAQSLKVDMTQLDVDRLVNNAKDRVQAKLTNFISSNVGKKVSELSKMTRDAYVVQDAINELVQPEPITTRVAGHQLPDSTFSVDINNPNSYNFVDDVKNWIKVDKVKRTLEAILTSGTLIKVDKNGDVTIRTPGSVKQIIEGNLTEDISGNHEMYIGGYQKVTVRSSVTEDYGNQTTNAGSFCRIRARMIDLN